MTILTNGFCNIRLCKTIRGDIHPSCNLHRVRRTPKQRRDEKILRKYVCIINEDDFPALHDYKKEFISRIQQVDRANCVSVFVLLDFIQQAICDQHTHHSDQSQKLTLTIIVPAPKLFTTNNDIPIKVFSDPTSAASLAAEMLPSLRTFSKAPIAITKRKVCAAETLNTIKNCRPVHKCRHRVFLKPAAGSDAGPYLRNVIEGSNHLRPEVRSQDFWRTRSAFILAARSEGFPRYFLDR